MAELATFLQVVVTIGAPIALVRALRRRWGIGLRAVVVGALAFVVSQVGHLPFLAYTQSLLPDPHSPAFVPAAGAYYGLAAGLFEEGARFVAMRWVLTRERTGVHALAYGAGHGGIESAFVGLLAGYALLQVLVIDRVGIENLGVDAAQLEPIRAGIDAYHRDGVTGALLGTMERLCTIPFHVAASTLVMRAVVERRERWLVLAIAMHAVSDGMLVPLRPFGIGVTELFVLSTLPVSLLTMALTYRALPKLAVSAREARPASSGAPIEVVRAEKEYGEVRALRGVSFTLREGERACLLGPNGAGKTTTIRMITGAIAPTRGFVFVLGDASDDPTFLEKKRRVGIVPQQPGMYEHLDVRGYLSLVRDLYGRGDTALDAARRLGLEEVLDRPTSELSGGMQRRLVLAAALLPHPDVLVLDEPSAGLDPVASRQMIEAVREASASRTTLLCTHNLAEAEELCDSVIILRAGEVVVHASLEELRGKVQSRIALRARGGAAGLVEALKARGHAPELEEGDVRVAMFDAEARAPGLLRELLAAGLDVFECRIVKPSLEDLFFRVVETGGVTPSVPPAESASPSAAGAPP